VRLRLKEEARAEPDKIVPPSRRLLVGHSGPSGHEVGDRLDYAGTMVGSSTSCVGSVLAPELRAMWRNYKVK
jgi:hypothetical protein